MEGTVVDWLAAQGPILVLPIFMGIFLGFGFWAYRPKNKKRMEHYADIPLEEQNNGD